MTSWSKHMRWAIFGGVITFFIGWLIFGEPVMAAFTAIGFAVVILFIERRMARETSRVLAAGSGNVVGEQGGRWRQRVDEGETVVLGRIRILLAVFAVVFLVPGIVDIVDGDIVGYLFTAVGLVLLAAQVAHRFVGYGTVECSSSGIRSKGLRSSQFLGWEEVESVSFGRAYSHGFRALIGNQRWVTVRAGSREIRVRATARNVDDILGLLLGLVKG